MIGHAKVARRIEIMLSWACNNNCIFCAEAENMKQAIKKNVFIRTFEDIKKDLVAGRNSGAEHVTFLGGEPTIYKDIFRVVETSKKLGYKTIYLATNARMCSNEEFTRRLVESGANEFTVSIHGSNKKIHEASTRANGSFEQTVKGLENLLKYAKVLTNTTINPENYKDLPDLISFLNKYNLDRTIISYPNIVGNSLLNVDKIPTFEECKPYILEAIERSRNKIRIMNVPPCFLDGHEEACDFIGFDCCICQYFCIFQKIFKTFYSLFK